MKVFDRAICFRSSGPCLIIHDAENQSGSGDKYQLITFPSKTLWRHGSNFLLLFCTHGDPNRRTHPGLRDHRRPSKLHSKNANASDAAKDTSISTITGDDYFVEVPETPPASQDIARLRAELQREEAAQRAGAADIAEANELKA